MRLNAKRLNAIVQGFKQGHEFGIDFIGHILQKLLVLNGHKTKFSRYPGPTHDFKKRTASNGQETCKFLGCCRPRPSAMLSEIETAARLN